jgi:CTP synthase
MQLLAVENARTEFQQSDANSTEFNPQTGNPIVSKFSDGKMRLGNQRIIITSKAVADIYSSSFGADTLNHVITERHRHRYFVRPSTSGIAASSLGTEEIPEILYYPGTEDISELLYYPTAGERIVGWRALGVQFHPEYTSRNNRPHPIFVEFLKRCLL